MPVIGIGFSTLIAIAFAIHVFYTAQDRYWLIILFIFPFFGSVIYFFVVLLPQLRGSRTGYHVESKLRKALSPHKELVEAQNAFEISPTIDTKLRLAKALVDSDRAQEALPYYEQALSGVYKTAPDILLPYADALFKDKQYPKALETIDILRQSNPNYRCDEGQLLYAKILVYLDQKELAKQEFNALVDYYPSFEAVSEYLQLLIDWHEITKAQQVLQDYKIRLKHMPAYAKRMNAQWIRAIKQTEKQLNRQING